MAKYVATSSTGAHRYNNIDSLGSIFYLISGMIRRTLTNGNNDFQKG